MFLEWPFSKIVCKILIRHKTWLWWMEAICTIQTRRNSVKILLWNRWSAFEILSQRCSFGEPCPKLFAKFWSVQKHGSGEWGLLALYEHEETLNKSSPKPLGKFWPNLAWMFLERSGCHGNQMEFSKQFLRNLLLLTHFKTCLRNFDPSTNMALVNGGYLHYTGTKKFLKILLPFTNKVRNKDRNE